MADQKDDDTNFQIDGLDTIVPKQSVKVEYTPVYSPETNIKDIVKSMDTFDRSTVNTQRMREMLADKLMNTAMNLDLSDITDADTSAAMTGIVNAARSVLNDIDKSAKDHVSTKLKQKDTETSAAAVDIASFLSKVKTTFEPTESGNVTIPTKADVDKILDEKMKEDGTVILDTELELGGGMLPQKKSEEDEENNE